MNAKMKAALLVIVAIWLGGGIYLLIQSPTVANTQQPLFTGHENHLISLSDASALTRAYRESVPAGSVLGGYFGGDALQSVLSQPKCVGIRAYFGRKTDGAPNLVIVGVDANGNDMTEGILLEEWWPCPPRCGVSNALTADVAPL